MSGSVALRFAAWFCDRARNPAGLWILLASIGAGAQTLAFTPGMASDFAGTGSVSYSPASFVGPVGTVALNFPRRVVVDANGNVYDIEKGGNVARVIASGKGAIPALPSVANPVAGTVYTVAGSGTTAVCPGKTDSVGDGCPATQASLNGPYSIAVDAHGNVYISDSGNFLIRVVYAGGTVPNLPANPVVGNMYAVAGTGSTGSSGAGGPALNAQIGASHGVAIDAQGNIYFADSGNQTIRAVFASGTVPGISSPVVGAVYTIAGAQGVACAKATSACGDGGPAIGSQINGPDSTTVDASGNIYFSDTSDFRIRAVYSAGSLPGISSPVVGDIYTVAGSGATGSSGDGGKATAATLTSGIGQVAIDVAGNLYIPDGSANVVRKVDASGVISTIFGGATVCVAHTDAAGDGCPATQATLNSVSGAAVDSFGNLYLADYKNNYIRLLNSGSSQQDFSGAIGSAIAIKTVPVSNTGTQPLAITALVVSGPFTQVSSGGSDCNSSTTLAPGADCMIGLAATGSQVGTSTGAVTITSNAKNGDSKGQNIVALSSALTQGATTTVLSVSPATANLGQTVTLIATVRTPTGISLSPGGSVTFSNGANAIGSGSVSAGVATFSTAGLAAGKYTITAAYSGDTNFSASNSSTTNLTVSSTPVPTVTLGASASTLDVGQSVTLTSTVTAFSGTQTPTGSVTFKEGSVLLGTSPLNGSGISTLAISNLPIGANNITAIYSGDGTFSANTSTGQDVVVSTPAQLSITPGVLSTVAGSHTLGAGFSGDAGAATAAQLKTPIGLAQDGAGNIYIADSGNNRIRKIDAQTGVITTFAGTGTACSATVKPCGDGGPAAAALLNTPEFVRVDAAGNLYIDDRKDNAIRMVSAKTGTISTVAGTLTSAGSSGDGGLATAAMLNGPRGLFVDNEGDLFIADSGNALVREVDALTGNIRTVAGSGSALGDGGPAISAQLINPRGLYVDAGGNLFIADIGSFRVRRVDASTGVITTVTGTGTACATAPCGDGGQATAAALGGPEDVLGNSAGDIFFSDPNLNVVRKIGTDGVISTVAGKQVTTGAYSPDGVLATTAELSYPNSLLLDRQGTLYVSEANNSLVRAISVNTSSLDFANVSLGATSNQTLTIENTGKEPLSISGISIDTQFTQQASSGFDCSGTTTLAAGQSCLLDVQFTPVTAGPISGSATIADNSENAAAGHNIVTLTGTGIASTGTNPQTLTFTVLPDVTYGTSPVMLSATASSGLAPTYSTVTGPATLMGNMLKITGAGTVSVTAYQFGDTTYAAATPVTRNFKVAPAPLTVTANDATRAVQTGNPPFTFSVSGFVNGDTNAVLSGAPQLSTAATVNSLTGNYPIAVSAGTLAAANYIFRFVNGTLTVSGASQTITFNPPASVTYGTQAILLSASASSGLPVIFSVVSGPGRLSGNSLSITGAGTVVVAASQSGDQIYAAAQAVTQSVTVAPALLTVKASDTSKVIGTANPTFTYSITGFVDGDTQAAVAGSPSFSSTAITVSPLGQYPITITQGSLFAANYTFQFVSGTLVVAPPPPDFSLVSNLGSLTLEPGVTGHLTVTLNSVGNYQGTVVFACSGLPSGSACAFSPSSLQMNATGATQVQLSVTTPQHSTSLRAPEVHTAARVDLCGMLGLPALLSAGLLFVWSRRSRRWLRGPGVLAVAVIFLGLMTGCGSSSTYAPATVSTVTVTASGSGTSGNVVHTFSFQLTVL